MTFEVKFGLHHIFLISWLGLFVGMICDTNLIPKMGWVEWIRVIGFLGLLYGVIGFYAWRNRIKIPKTEGVK